MKEFALGYLALLALALALQAGPALAQDKTHDIKAQIVSADMDGNALTYKVDSDAKE
jgi:hypothetical protein